MKIDGRGWTGCGKQIERLLSARENAVLACSALKHAYRDRLRVSDEVKFVFLRGDYRARRKTTAQPAPAFYECELVAESVR